MTDRNKWASLWVRIGAVGDPLPAHDALVRAYCEKHRAYHNLRHIEDCLQQLGPVTTLAGDAEACELALWLHDVVYDPRRADNEERSADWARQVCRQAGLPADREARVADLILATRHDATPTLNDAQLVVDIDLSILGRDPERFDAYERAVREEYRWVPDLLFRPGRRKILLGFLARPRIYSTEWFFRRYEAIARSNLARSLEQLGG